MSREEGAWCEKIISSFPFFLLWWKRWWRSEHIAFTHAKREWWLRNKHVIETFTHEMNISLICFYFQSDIMEDIGSVIFKRNMRTLSYKLHQKWNFGWLLNDKNSLHSATSKQFLKSLWNSFILYLFSIKVANEASILFFVCW